MLILLGLGEAAEEQLAHRLRSRSKRGASDTTRGTKRDLDRKPSTENRISTASLGRALGFQSARDYHQGTGLYSQGVSTTCYDKHRFVFILMLSVACSVRFHLLHIE